MRSGRTGKRRWAALAGALAALPAPALADVDQTRPSIVDRLAIDPARTAPNRLSVTPRIEISADTNVLLVADDRVTGGTDDVVTTPTVAVEFAHALGRSNASLVADLGYDIYARHGQLDQVRVDASARGHLALGGFCGYDPSGRLTVRQSNDAQLTGNFANRQTALDLVGTLACPRPVGLYPSITVEHASVANDDPLQARFDQHSDTARGGIGYAVPSIGSLVLEYGRTRIRQPDNLVNGRADGSTVDRYLLQFRRAVAPRISFAVDASWLDVRPRSPGTPRYGGAGYDVTIDVHPSPRYRLVVEGRRDIVGSGYVAVSYVIDQLYAVRGVALLSNRATLSVEARYVDRTFRGESAVYFAVLRGWERGPVISADLGYDLGRRVRAGLFASYASVDSAGDFYDYDRAQAGLSLGARF